MHLCDEENGVLHDEALTQAIINIGYAPYKLAPTHIVVAPENRRRVEAILCWPNWYISRGRMSHNATRAERRRVSWRRAV